MPTEVHTRVTNRLRRNLSNLRQLSSRAARFVCGNMSKSQFTTSAEYWERRYASGATSGAGSQNQLAEFKAKVINGFVRRRGIRDVIEFGCGDGNQLALSEYSNYLGIDISPSAVAACRSRFAGDASKQFMLLSEYAGQRAQLSLSLDVIYHLTEDAAFENYITRLFDAAREYVIIYSSDMDSRPGEWAPHVRHRVFTQWVDAHRPDWTLESTTSNPYPFDRDTQAGSLADFYIYRRRGLADEFGRSAGGAAGRAAGA